MLRYLQQTTARRRRGQGRTGQSTRTRRPSPTCTLSLALPHTLPVCMCFLSLLLSSCHFFHVCVSAYNVSPLLPLLLLLFLPSPSPSFLLERCKPLIFGYVFLHFCSLFAFDLIVGSGCASLTRSHCISLSAACQLSSLSLPTFNEMSTKDQALCDSFAPAPLSAASSRRRLSGRVSDRISARISRTSWHLPWHSFSIIFRLTKCTQTVKLLAPLPLLLLLLAALKAN